MSNAFRSALSESKCPVQAWMWNPSTLFTEIVARSGFDSIGFDLQHGAIDFNNLYSLMAVAEAYGSTPMVRIPMDGFGYISRILDGGAGGVICPDVRTAAEAHRFVSECKYAPVGKRGFGPVRPAFGALRGGYSAGFDVAKENSRVMAIIQIESPEGLENIEEILSVPGIDGVFPGMVDYSLLAYGTVITDLQDPRLAEPAKAIIKACHAAGVPVGLPALTPDQIGYVRSLGVDWLQVGNDVAWISAAAKQALAAAKPG